ncbi:MAG: site-specific DNA-methyltransferase, partial [Nanoarchaeota archaeon]|nr:site-specific DNA-methyltransferase [Nanoarchaeota archaeon]
MDKLRMQTKNLSEENLNKLTQLFPDILTEVEEDGKLVKRVNVHKLNELLGGFTTNDSEVYELTWAGKQKSKQKLLNPINKTLRPIKEDSIDFENTENLYIEGDNYEVLKLLQESYLNKIKMIYIDPPYNTGKDFVYKDNFSVNKEDYEEDSGSIDEEGNKLFKNTTTNGRFHSDWLSMMYERLVVARDLLTEEGVIFISIDDNEYTNLYKICEEIFGELNLKTLAIKMSEASGLKMASVINVGSIPKLKEYVIIAKKTGIKNLFFDKISKGKWDNEYNIFLKNFSKEDKIKIEEVSNKENITEEDIIVLDKIAERIKIESVSNILKSERIEKKLIEEWLFENSWRICRTTASSSLLILANEKRKTNNNQLFFVKSKTGILYFVKGDYSFESKKPRVQMIFAEDNLEQHPGDFWSHIKTTGLDNEGGVPYKNGKKPLNLLKSLIKSNIGN